MSKYYIPSVSADGILTWTPSEAGMPAIEAVNIIGPEGKIGIRGPQGPAGIPGADGTVEFNQLTELQLQMITGPEGDCGVYVGAAAPVDEDKLIWVDTLTDFTDELATKNYVDEAVVKNLSGGEVTLESYASKDYVASYVSSVLVDYYTKGRLDETFAQYYTKAQIDGMFTKLAANQGIASSEGVIY